MQTRDVVEREPRLWNETDVKEVVSSNLGAICKCRDKFFYKLAIPDLYFLHFVFSTVNSMYVHYKVLPMTGFEPRTFDIQRDHSGN